MWICFHTVHCLFSRRRHQIFCWYNLKPNIFQSHKNHKNYCGMGVGGPLNYRRVPRKTHLCELFSPKPERALQPTRNRHAADAQPARSWKAAGKQPKCNQQEADKQPRPSLSLRLRAIALIPIRWPIQKGAVLCKQAETEVPARTCFLLLLNTKPKSILFKKRLTWLYAYDKRVIRHTTSFRYGTDLCSLCETCNQPSK